MPRQAFEGAVGLSRGCAAGCGCSAPAHAAALIGPLGVVAALASEYKLGSIHHFVPSVNFHPVQLATLLLYYVSSGVLVPFGRIPAFCSYSCAAHYDLRPPLCD